MLKHSKILFTALFILTLTTAQTHALIVEFLQELAALSQFNAHNRQALYQALSGAYQETDIFTPLFEHDNHSESTTKTFTFRDIAGNIPQDVLEVVEFIREPERFARVGAQMPKGVLLYGPPGTGKTSLARAIAGEAGAEFFHASGSEFVEVYVGVGPQRVRELFAKAQRAPKAIIFIDEIDAIGGKRTGENNSEYRNTLNELLNQMDGFKQNNITVIAATNRPRDLDSALLRPGRFDRLVEIPLPDCQSREAIIQHYCTKVTYKGSQEFFAELAKKTCSFSGADIKNIVNEAAVFAVRNNQDYVSEENLLQGLQKINKQKNR